MVIIAKRSVQLNGHIYSNGEAAEYNGPVDCRIAANFVSKDGKPLAIMPPKANGKENGNKEDSKDADTQGRIKKLVKDLGAKGIMQKLDDLGVSYSSQSSDSQLAQLLLQQQGELPL